MLENLPDSGRPGMCLAKKNGWMWPPLFFQHVAASCHITFCFPTPYLLTLTRCCVYLVCSACASSSFVCCLLAFSCVFPFGFVSFAIHHSPFAVSASSKYRPNSPRSLEACLTLGIDPRELIYRPVDFFASPNLTEDLQKMKYEKFERIRVDRLKK